MIFVHRTDMTIHVIRNGTFVVIDPKELVSIIKNDGVFRANFVVRDVYVSLQSPAHQLKPQPVEAVC